MRRSIMMILFALVSVIGLSAQTIRVQVPNMVAADEQFNVTFIVEGESSPSEFDWNPGDDFRLVWGPQKGSSSQVQIINGKMTKSSQVSYSYILLPVKTGKCVIPSATATVKGQKLSSALTTVEVVSQGAASQGQSQGAQNNRSTEGAATPAAGEGDLFLTLSVSKKNLVVGEPVRAEIKIYQRVNIAGFEDFKLPSFNGFWSQEIDTPSNIEFHRENYGGQIYNAAVLRGYVLIPQQAGSLTIDPSELVCLVNVRTQSRSNSIFDSFFQDNYTTTRRRISSDPVTVKVAALPAGSPSSYGGGVGEFKMNASLTRDTLTAHNAASLIITISGKGNVSLLEEPKVQFPVDFEVYDTKVSEKTNASDGRTSGSKVFEYPFIPRSHGSFEIPSVKYSYYDIRQGRYVTLETEPLLLEVNKGRESEQGQVPAVSGVIRKDVRNLGSDVRHIHAGNPSDLRKSGRFFVASPLFFILLAFMLAGAAFIAFFVRSRQKMRSDVVATRKKGASKIARKRLSRAQTYLKDNLYTAFYEELHRALLGYVGDKLNMDMTDMTKDNISTSLQSGGVSESDAAALVSLLDACEFARYAPSEGQAAMSAHFDAAVDVISVIDDSYKAESTRGKRQSGTMTLVALLLGFAAFSLDASASSTEVQQLWEDGTGAYAEGDYAKSAELWGSIEDMGLESADLYYNLGNAYFKQDYIAHAILYYEKALKLDPSMKDARFNLEYASSLTQDRIEVIPEFFLVAFWRKLTGIMSSDAWAIVALLMFLALLCSVLLFALSRKSSYRKAGFFAGIAVLVFFVVSLSASISIKNQYYAGDRAVVMVPVASVKSSPSSDAAKDLFVLHEGTRVKAIDELGDWVNIELQDGRQGWVKKEIICFL